jgi:O-antigen/teichoic acid export membrane protein
MAQAYINPYSIIISSTLGMVFLQIASIIATKVFHKDPIYLGPFMLMLLVAGAVYAAYGVMEKILQGYGMTNKGAIANYILMLGVSVILIALLYFLVPQWVPEIFQPSVAAARASLGMP